MGWIDRATESLHTPPWALADAGGTVVVGRAVVVWQRTARLLDGMRPSGAGRRRFALV